MRQLHLRIAFLSGMLLLSLARPSAAQPPLPAVNASRIEFSADLHNGDRVGRIRILGLLELPSFSVDGLRFAEFSDLAWDDDDGVLYAESDQGGLFWLKPVFSHDYLTDVKLLKAVPLRELGSNKPVRWKRTDAEGMDILKGRNGRPHDAELVISFEREQRIMRYRTDGVAIAQYGLPKPLDDINNYNGPNKALEGICNDPQRGPLTAPELPLRNERPGYTRLFDLNGGSWYFPAEKNSGVVALECIGQGNVLVLERDYLSAIVHTIVTLKQLHLPPGPARGATLEAQTLARLDDTTGLRLDNFEGLTRHRGNRFFMISDNNDVFLQRTLLLYFEIVGK